MIINSSYIRSLPGLLKIGEIVLQVILIICLSIATGNIYAGAIGFAWFTCIVSMIWVVISLIFYLIGFYDQQPSLPWNLIKLIITCVWVLFHFISGAICAKYSSDFASAFKSLSNCANLCDNIVGGLGAAAFFHFASMIVLGVEAFLYFMASRSRNSSNNQAAPAN